FISTLITQCPTLSALSSSPPHILALGAPLASSSALLASTHTSPLSTSVCILPPHAHSTPSDFFDIILPIHPIFSVCISTPRHSLWALVPFKP
ncbi:hypothetical protein K443DRAFT_666473, partial [Laccaria amethystina LaAM-08-1]